MTDEQAVKAVREFQAARGAAKAAYAELERIEERCKIEIAAAEERYHVASRRVTAARQAVCEDTTESAAQGADPATPEQTGTTPPTLDIHDILASGEIPGAPVVGGAEAAK